MAKRKRTTAERPAPRVEATNDIVGVRILPTGEEIPLGPEQRRLSVGTDGGNDVVLEDPYVSGFHCVLERVGRTVVVRDHQSRNGTFVAGVAIEREPLTPGTCVRLGDHALVALGTPRRGATPLEQLAGRSAVMRRALGETLRAARTSASLLLQGESGSGKELFARLVHEASPRARGPFVAVDCGAIPRELLESELFGHERGAFTGAAERRTGVLQQADGGSLFLDEIGELPPEQQARLLRVLETRRVRRVGGSGEEPIDVRVLSATHRDLRSSAGLSGGFRLDLFHRLCGMEVRLPPLRERIDDLPLLLQRFLVEAEHAGPVDASLVPALRRYHWPGNVRELRHAVQRAALMGDGKLRIEHLLPHRPLRMMHPLEPHAQPSPPTRASIEHALGQGRSLREAAAILGVARSTFYDRLRRLGLSPNVRRAR
jgi:DNA-binding NtrC family response regulator